METKPMVAIQSKSSDEKAQNVISENLEYMVLSGTKGRGLPKL